MTLQSCRCSQIHCVMPLQVRLKSIALLLMKARCQLRHLQVCFQAWSGCSEATRQRSQNVDALRNAKVHALAVHWWCITQWTKAEGFHRRGMLAKALAVWKECSSTTCVGFESSNNALNRSHCRDCMLAWSELVAAVRFAMARTMRRAFVSWQIHNLQERLVRHMTALHSRRLALHALRAWAAVSSVCAAEARVTCAYHVLNASPAALGALLKFQQLQHALPLGSQTAKDLHMGTEKLSCDGSMPKITSAALRSPLPPEIQAAAPVSEHSHSLCGGFSPNSSTNCSHDSTATLSLPGENISSAGGWKGDTKCFPDKTCIPIQGHQDERTGSHVQQDQVDLSPPQPPEHDLSSQSASAAQPAIAAWPAWISPTKCRGTLRCPLGSGSSSMSVRSTASRPTMSSLMLLRQAFQTWRQACCGQV
jgi:hypothetical protein